MYIGNNVRLSLVYPTNVPLRTNRAISKRIGTPAAADAVHQQTVPSNVAVSSSAVELVLKGKAAGIYSQHQLVRYFVHARK